MSDRESGVMVSGRFSIAAAAMPSTRSLPACRHPAEREGFGAADDYTLDEVDYWVGWMQLLGEHSGSPILLLHVVAVFG